MMTQEEFMDVKALHAASWTIRQIAEHMGYHPGHGVGLAEAGRSAPAPGARRRRGGGGPAMAGKSRHLLGRNAELAGSCG